VSLRAACAVLLLATLARAGASEAPAVADCVDEAWERVLQPLADPGPRDAAAIWLSAERIRWPGKPADARYRLVHSTRAGLVVRPGAAVQGAERSWDLGIDAAPLDPALIARFPHVGAGVTLALGSTPSRELDTMLVGQLLLVQQDAAGRVLDATRLQPAGALDARYAAAAETVPLGVEIAGRHTRFALWAPTASRVAICLHETEAVSVLPMKRDPASGIWHGGQARDLGGGYYTFLVDVFVPGIGEVRNRVTDPYATSLDADSRRTWIGRLDSPRTMPKGWSPASRPDPAAHATDMVIYELHVRDFSIGDATVPAGERGKYGAFGHPDSDGMRHLRALAAAGLTDIHLLPVFDLATVPEVGCVTPTPSGAPDGESQQAAVMAVRERDCFNWGYDPLHFTAPEGSYAADPHDGAARVREFRAMVMALHRAGLRVGMDVVYNHTSASGQDRRSVLDRIVPGYYHRLDARGQVERSTCCDNTATEHRMMAKLMRDSLVVWARDYRIDSFRFDLMGHQPREAMLDSQRAVNAAAGRMIPFIGEGWNFGEVADGARFVQAAQGRLDGTGIATFSDRARDAARGGGCCDSGRDLVSRQGWLNGLHYAPNEEGRAATHEDLMRAADLVRVGLAGSLRDFEMEDHRGARVALQRIDYVGQSAGYVSQPGEVVNYVENHDNPTLFDINVLKLPRDTPRADRARVQLLGAALVAFSQGIAYYHAGIDTLRSKSLDRNSFDSGDWFNRLDWTYRENFFGTGLPPQPENGVNWPWLRPRLADPSIKPAPADIAFMRDAFRDLLRIRASSSLFRLRTADEVRARLRLHNTGPGQSPTLLVGELDGTDHAGAQFARVMYFINAGLDAADLALEAGRELPWQLHPVQRAPDAADARAREARFDPSNGRFTIPPRTALVYVVE
jgi:pullulanase